MAIEAAARLKYSGHPIAMVIRGGIEPHGGEVLRPRAPPGAARSRRRGAASNPGGVRRAAARRGRGGHLQSALLRARGVRAPLLRRRRRGAGQQRPRAVRPGRAGGDGRRRHRLHWLNRRGLRRSPSRTPWRWRPRTPTRSSAICCTSSATPEEREKIRAAGSPHRRRVHLARGHRESCRQTGLSRAQAEHRVGVREPPHPLAPLSHRRGGTRADYHP